MMIYKSGDLSERNLCDDQLENIKIVNINKHRYAKSSERSDDSIKSSDSIDLNMESISYVDEEEKK